MEFRPVMTRFKTTDKKYSIRLLFPLEGIGFTDASVAYCKGHTHFPQYENNYVTIMYLNDCNIAIHNKQELHIGRKNEIETKLKYIKKYYPID